MQELAPRDSLPAVLRGTSFTLVHRLLSRLLRPSSVPPPGKLAQQVSRGLGGGVWTSPNSRAWARWSRGAEPEPDGCLFTGPTRTVPRGAYCRKGKPRLGGSHISSSAQALLPALPAPPLHLYRASAFKATGLVTHPSTLQATGAQGVCGSSLWRGWLWDQSCGLRDMPHSFQCSSSLPRLTGVPWLLMD